MMDRQAILSAAARKDAEAVKDLIVPFLPELIDLNPATGDLTWRERGRDWFATEKAWKCWNGRYPGTPALATVKNHGYRAGAILGVYFLAHRVVWAMVHGEWPTECDHERGNRTDNRPAKLADATHSGNQRNCRRRIDNTSGRTGVYLRKSATRPWQASIFYDGRLRLLGYFATKEEAIGARASAEDAIGFHPNHGDPNRPHYPRAA